MAPRYTLHILNDINAAQIFDLVSQYDESSVSSAEEVYLTNANEEKLIVPPWKL